MCGALLLYPILLTGVILLGEAGQAHGAHRAGRHVKRENSCDQAQDAPDSFEGHGIEEKAQTQSEQCQPGEEYGQGYRSADLFVLEGAEP